VALNLSRGARSLHRGRRAIASEGNNLDAMHRKARDRYNSAKPDTETQTEGDAGAFRERRPVYGRCPRGCGLINDLFDPPAFYADASRCRSIEFYLNTPAYVCTRARARVRSLVYVHTSMRKGDESRRE